MVECLLHTRYNRDNIIIGVMQWKDEKNHATKTTKNRADTIESMEKNTMRKSQKKKKNRNQKVHAKKSTLF